MGALARLALRWWGSFQGGLARQEVEDRLGSSGDGRTVRQRLANLWPFVRAHWRLGLLGAALLLFGSLVVLPQPLVSRYLIDEVLLGKRLELLAVVLGVLGALKLFGYGEFAGAELLLHPIRADGVAGYPGKPCSKGLSICPRRFLTTKRSGT